jgi:hypothetical protein
MGGERRDHTQFHLTQRANINGNASINGQSHHRRILGGAHTMLNAPRTELLDRVVDAVSAIELTRMDFGDLARGT